MYPNEQKLFKDILKGQYRDCYLIYNRKSTDEPENQKNSIQYQKLENGKFVIREKLRLAPISLKGFCADGIISEKHSGFKEDNNIHITKEGLVQYRIERPKFQKLVQFLSKDLFKGVIFLCWDRVSRNRGDDTVIRKLMRKGIDVRFTYANYAKTSSGALHMDIDGMFAEHHSRVTSEKVTIATWNLREQGICTYRAPMGYLNIGRMDQKPFDPERAPIIKNLFAQYATGEWSLSDLARWANKQGLTTVPMRRRRTEDEMLAEEDDEKEIMQVSRPVTLNHVHKILTNPFYTGKILGNNGEYVMSKSHEPLVSETLFNHVQGALNGKKVSIHYTEKIDLPFRGRIRCGKCGRVYTPYMQKGILYFGSRCPSGCANTFRSFNIGYIENEIGKLIAKLSFTEDELAEIEARTSTDVVLFDERRQKNIEQNERTKKKLHEDLSYLLINRLTLLKWIFRAS
ncbi:MAG: recombinase family protein [Bacteroidota bacterium]